MRLVSFQIGTTCYALEASHVIEILRAQAITTVHRAHPAIAGLINLRGQIVVAVDLAYRLGLTSGTNRMSVLVRTPDGPTSLLVDRIGDVLDLDPVGFIPVPDTLPAHLRSIVTGSFQFPDRLVHVLDADRVASFQDDGGVS